MKFERGFVRNKVSMNIIQHHICQQICAPNRQKNQKIIQQKIASFLKIFQQSNRSRHKNRLQHRHSRYKNCHKNEKEKFGISRKFDKFTKNSFEIFHNYKTLKMSLFLHFFLRPNMVRNIDKNHAQ